MISPAVNGPEVTRVFTNETSAEAAAGPPVPGLAVVLGRFGSESAAMDVGGLLNAPAALIGAMTLIVVLAPEARLAMAQGKAAQPPAVTFVMVMFVGESVTWMLVAVEGPASATTRV